MARRPTTPRKNPRQARARDTVEALLEATGDVLVAHGYERASTARIARRAGVAIGSLYQYFPNKEALVATLIERDAARAVTLVQSVLAGCGDDPRATVRALARIPADTERIEPALHRVLHEQVPRVGRLADARAATKQITIALAAHLARFGDALRVRDRALAALVVETALEGLTHRLVHEPVGPEERVRLEAELEHMLGGYLFGLA